MAKKNDTAQSDILDTNVYEEPMQNALSEPTAEDTQTTENAKELKDNSTNFINANSIDIPSLSGLQPGDTLDVLVTFKVSNVDKENDNYVLEPIDYIPREEIMGSESIGSGMGPTTGAPSGPGGLNGLLG